MRAVIASPKASLIRQLALLSLVGFAYFLGSVAALHLLRPDYSPISRTVSEYAVGAYSPLMTSSFIALGFGSLALVVALALGGFATDRSRVGLVLLILWSIGVLLLSIFPADRHGIPVSTSGFIHSFTALLALICFICASPLFSLRFRSDEQWQSVARPLLILTVLLFVAFVVFLASPPALKGITERLLLLIVLMWFALVALKLRTLYLTS